MNSIHPSKAGVAGRHRTGCLLCGKPVIYGNREAAHTCSICGRSFTSNAQCPDGHYVCDNCHSAGTPEWVRLLMERMNSVCTRDAHTLGEKSMRSYKFAHYEVDSVVLKCLLVVITDLSSLISPSLQACKSCTVIV